MKLIAAILVTVLTPAVTLASGFSIGSDGYLKLNGTTFIPKGIYSVPTGAAGDDPSGGSISNAKSLGINVAVNPYWAVDYSTSEGTLNVLGTYNLYGIVGIDPNGDGRVSAKAVTSYVNRIKSHPALMAYMQPDEAISIGISPTKLKTLYNAIRAADKTTPVLLVDYDVTAPKKAAGSYDVAIFDEYPIGRESIATWQGLLHTFVQNAKPKPTWVILQAFYSGPWMDECCWSQPTLAQLRQMVAAAKAEGVKGWLSYEYNCTLVDPADTYCLTDHQTLYSDLRTVFSEIN